MDMSKYRALFFSEAREHLAGMGRLLVALEHDSRDVQTVEALFREAHSIKGMAASMGYDRTAELAHGLEDMLDRCRAGGEVPPARVDRLLQGVDLLESLINDLDADQPEREISDFLGELKAAEPAGGKADEKITAREAPLPGRMESGVSPEPAQPESGRTEKKASEGVEDELKQERSLKKWDVRIELAPGTAMPAARLLLLLNRIKPRGRILACSPDEKSLQDGGAHLRLELRLESGDDGSALRDLFKGHAEIGRLQVAPHKPPVRRASSRRAEQARTVRVRTELLDHFINLAGEMITQRHRLHSAQKNHDWEDLRGGIDGMARLVTDLHHHILKVRMMPLESITGHLPRVVRDLSRKSGKQVSFTLSGEEIELDRAILEELADPLVHMVRNAVDHGIEQSGRVRIEARREKDLVVLEVMDDGRGIDPEAVRRKAVQRGLLSAEQVRQLPESDLLLLVCRPGFSTADEVTDVSGRGVGMDVVKTVVESFGGTVELFSRPGKGTRIQLKLPLSVAIIQLLLVRCGTQLVGLPITCVQQLLTLTRDQIQSSGKRLAVRYDDAIVPLLSLRKMLQIETTPLSGSIPVVVTEMRGRRIGLVVDALAGQREAFVKTLEFPLNQIAGVTGASILGDGRILFVIDPRQMLQNRAMAPPQRAGACV
ncbi:MAG: chemotaxis protein CheA [Thermodesulfobacteriota bacterium]|jgi:two-component system chemotaxis sensor kinase CheA|nr:chemotaxis protein CheA [Thermodesulfobacteriota bacterium]